MCEVGYGQVRVESNRLGGMSIRMNLKRRNEAKRTEKRRIVNCEEKEERRGVHRKCGTSGH